MRDDEIFLSSLPLMGRELKEKLKPVISFHTRCLSKILVYRGSRVVILAEGINQKPGMFRFRDIWRHI